MGVHMVFATGLGNPECPVLLPDGSWIVVEMAPDRGCVTHLTSDGTEKRIIARTGRPNGCAVDGDGNIWVAESRTPPSLKRMTMEGKIELVLTEGDDGPFLWPNDLCFGPDGALYMTDSGMIFAEWNKNRANYKNALLAGRVYRIDTETKEVQTLDKGIRFTNGIAFGPDNSLYVNETVTGNIYRYRWREDHVEKKRELFANVLDPEGPEQWKGPDGMAFGTDGRLYVTVFTEGVVAVIGQDGLVSERLPLLGKRPTNVAFGPVGEHRIYVTEQEIGTIETYEVNVDGLPLHEQPR
jgi:gluconolactonase